MGWHCDPTDAIAAAALAHDGEDVEPLEAFTIVVENLPSGFEAMWADRLVEKLGQQEGYFCSQVVQSPNSSMSTELHFTSKKAARGLIDKAHGMKVRCALSLFRKPLLILFDSLGARFSLHTPSSASLRTRLQTLATNELPSRPCPSTRRTRKHGR